MAPSLHLILTVDYEVFGNGSGCVEQCVLIPAERIARQCMLVNAPVTFFVEAVECWVMSREYETAIYSDAISVQLQDFLMQGHDVQLHLHPQFDQAIWNGTTWKVKDSWRIGDYKEKDVKRLIKKGIFFLQEVISKINPEYKCIAFRAGGWCIQPSDIVLECLMTEGFVIDSTVAEGYANFVKEQWVDFSTVPQKPFWEVSNDICREERSGFFECPIATGRINKLRHYLYVLRAKKYGNNGLAEGCSGNYTLSSDSKGNGMFMLLSKIKRLGHVMLDFSTMPSEVLIDITCQWIDKFSTTHEYIPIVAIAHTKNFTSESERNLSDYLIWAKKEGINFSTYGEFFNLFLNR